MFGVSETPYDLRFRFLDIPVRVHPLFWLGSALLAGTSEKLTVIVAWVACVFVSILVHEYGHGLTAKAFHSSPSIILWMGGGLCSSQVDRQTPMQRLAVVLWGPGAGFVLCGVVMLVFSALYGLDASEHLGVVLHSLGLPADDFAMSFEHYDRMGTYGRLIYSFLVQINLFWGLVNLLPIWPLDGGHVCEILFSLHNPYQAKRRTHTIGLVTAGSLAVLSYLWTREYFLAIFFGFFAFLNYQTLQTIHQAQVMGLYDEDWWRR